MLKCRDIAHQGSDHADGRMTWRQSLSYGFHLLMCGHCRTFVRHLRTTIAFTRTLPDKDTLSIEQVNTIVSHAIAQEKNP
ncbi:MAG: anti-sigma factor [Gammaproteobacteria bacterium]|nr:anti-sigma factor [Gammaproteobacteria bacterium]MDP2346444.1 anti-sigma factor [Gammaproteobacteria bacterium]